MNGGFVQKLNERIANLEQALREERQELAFVRNSLAIEREESRAELSRLRSQVEAMGKPFTQQERIRACQRLANRGHCLVSEDQIMSEIRASRQQSATEKG